MAGGLRQPPRNVVLTRSHPANVLLVATASFCLAAVLAIPGCSWRGQRYRHLITPTPLPEADYLVLGFLGGRDRWDDDTKGVRKLALKLRAMNLEGVHVETVENAKRALALELIRNALDRNHDGRLDEQERRSARIIVYGQSFGGAAVVKLSRQLNQLGVPVFLTVQVDSVGRSDGTIPPNVRCAANLYQSDGWLIRGEKTIQAEDAEKTRIVGNFKYSYADKEIDLSDVPWLKKVFRTAHTKMDHDPEVWVKVEELLLGAVRGDPCGAVSANRALEASK